MELLNLTLGQLTTIFQQEFQKGGFHAAVLFREVFKNGNPQFLNADEFIKSPKFASQLENRMVLSPGKVVERIHEDGLTKFVTRLVDHQKIESVIIPMTNHKTLCVSSQVGCRMGCRFCETGKMGFVRNLDVNEITGQLFNARFVLKEPVKNIVFMGMGEPFDNFDNVTRAIRVMNEQKGFDVAHRHITISTAGMTRGIKRLAGLGMKGLRLAVSINAPDDRTRSFLMPINTSASLEELKKTLKEFPLPQRGCFLFEYILIKGLNDSQKDAITLADYIKPLPVRLNLIPYNPVDGFNYASPSDDEMNRFADTLTKNGIFVIKRWSRGRSVCAGCGQLGRQCGSGR